MAVVHGEVLASRAPRLGPWIRFAWSRACLPRHRPVQRGHQRPRADWLPVRAGDLRLRAAEPQRADACCSLPSGGRVFCLLWPSRFLSRIGARSPRGMARRCDRFASVPSHRAPAAEQAPQQQQGGASFLSGRGPGVYQLASFDDRL